jgi:hypothetical protein
VYDCVPGYPSRYNGPFIFNPDRSRFNASGYDWSSTPVDTGAPLSEDYGVIENNQPNPAAADLDGDGELEIVNASYDGRARLAGQERAWSWPSVYSPAEGTPPPLRPAIADLDLMARRGDLRFLDGGSNKTGKLHILDYLGTYSVDLPGAYGARTGTAR